VSDLAQALISKGLRLIVYLPSGAPEADSVAVQKLGWQKGSYRNREFENKWEKVIAEWSIRWGAKVSGWWFDGCYWPNTMYRHSEPPNFTSFAAAARKGNPGSVVAFNAGVVAPIMSITGEEDYTAGETNEPLSISCPAPRIDGVQWHMLTYLGEGWAHGKPRFETQQFAAWGAEQIARGGAITWEVPADSQGGIGQEFLSQLKAFGQAVSNH
jgi:hypothetical protein